MDACFLDTEIALKIESGRALEMHFAVRVYPESLILESQVKDAIILNRPWRHPNIDGSQDRRFNENPRDYTYRLWLMEVEWGEREFSFLFSSKNAAVFAAYLGLIDDRYIEGQTMN
jgi:hypothetical protein